MAQRVVIVTGDGASFLLEGDPDEGQAPYEVDPRGLDAMRALPALLAEGWKVSQVTPGSGAGENDTPLWLVVLERSQS